jgi:hypothetical protein
VRFNCKISLFLAALLSLSCSNAALADKPAPDASAPAPQDAAPADPTLTKQKNLEGHIQDEAVALEVGIKDLNKSLHHMKRSAWDIFVEVQRQNMVVVGEPDVIGPIIIPAIPNPTGTMAVGGFLPPRKKFLDYFVSQIDDLVQMIQTEVTGLVLPDDANDEAKADLKEITDAMAQIPQDISGLKDVTQGPDYDNMAIARAAQILQDRIGVMEKASKKLNSEAKKEESRAKKGLRNADNAIKKEQRGK